MCRTLYSSLAMLHAARKRFPVSGTETSLLANTTSSSLACSEATAPVIYISLLNMESVSVV